MLNFLLFLLPIFLPALVLSLRFNTFSENTRYFLAILPMICSGLGWMLAPWAYDVFGCEGPPSDVRSCLTEGIDISSVIEGMGAMMFSFFLLAIPISFGLLLYVAYQNRKGKRHP